MDRRIKRSRQQELDGARRYGGRVNARSGAGDVRKNDVQTEDESIEFKITEQSGYRLRIVDLIQAWVHATLAHRKMIFGIEFAEKSVTALDRRGPMRWVVLPEDDFLAMRQKISDLEDEREQLVVYFEADHCVGDERWEWP